MNTYTVTRERWDSEDRVGLVGAIQRHIGGTLTMHTPVFLAVATTLPAPGQPIITEVPEADADYVRLTFRRTDTDDQATADATPA